jgi:hypothetical protein
MTAPAAVAGSMLGKGREGQSGKKQRDCRSVFHIRMVLRFVWRNTHISARRLAKSEMRSGKPLLQ